MNAPALTFRARPARRLRALDPAPTFPCALEPMSDDAIDDISCRSEIAHEMRLAAHGRPHAFAGALNCAADALTSSNDAGVRLFLDVLPLHCTARRLFVALCDAITARDFVTVTDALDAWERSGEMEPALWMLTGDAESTDGGAL